MMQTHPLDDQAFAQWLQELDYEPQFTYGIYDGQWAELYNQFIDERE